MKGINIKGIQNIRESFKTRQVKYGGYAALITIAVIVGLILLNLLAGQFTTLQVDLTYSKIFSLSEQTIQVLEKVNSPVTIYGLWRPGEENQDVTPIINLYLAKNRNIKLDVVDPDKNPGFVVRYDKERKGIARGSLIVEGDKGFKVISPYDMYDITQNRQGSGSSVTGVAVERRITSALLFAGTGNTPVIYEITGHGEIPLSGLNLVDTVERENFTLSQVNLLLSAVPPDAGGLILNNPRRDLTSGEAERMLDYLGKGGRLIILADYSIQELANLNTVLASYGVKLNFGIVHEADANYFTLDARLAIPDMLEHDITKPLMDKSRTPVVMPMAMSVTNLDTKKRSTEIVPLMTTSPRAYLRTNLEETATIRVPSDVPGPLTLGVAVKDPSWIQGSEPQTRIIILGSGSLLPFYAQYGMEANRDLFMNSFAWLQDRPETISVRSKSLFILPLRLNMAQIIIFGGLFILIIPMAFFVTGFITWLKRRHL